MESAKPSGVKIFPQSSPSKKKENEEEETKEKQAAV